MSKILDDNTDIRKLQSGNPNRDIDPYELLRNGIIIHAVKDYRKALKTLRRGRKNECALRMKEDCENFFLSDYYYELTDVDGATLLRILNEECVLSDKARSV